ncbi:MAG TPA: hypothetical protein GX516_01990 [Thermoanaerobacter sp.]|nr:hypothetical protein [Thermoanaerobacter sp.]
MSMIGISVECIFKGERTEELSSIIKTIYRTESTISNSDVYVPYMLPTSIMNALESAVIYVDDVEYIDNEKILYVKFIDTGTKPKLSFYLEMAKFYNLKLYLSVVSEEDEIFFNTDEEREYFPEKYYFNIYTDSISYPTTLIKKLREISRKYGVYFENLEPFQETLKEYSIETKEDIYSLQSYLQNAYPSLTMFFSCFVNPLLKK